ncbi:MAG: 50S ribosomal protein L35ae [Nitrososphaeria archaeon]
MRAIVVGYRRGLGKINQGVSLVRVLDWDWSTNIIGWVVVARDRHGNVYEGRVVARHGRGNVFRVRFEPHLPGQMLGGLAEVRAPARPPAQATS